MSTETSVLLSAKRGMYSITCRQAIRCRASWREFLKHKPRNLRFHPVARLCVPLVARALDLAPPFGTGRFRERGIGRDPFRLRRPAAGVVAGERSDIGFVVGKVLDHG